MNRDTPSMYNSNAVQPTPRHVFGRLRALFCASLVLASPLALAARERVALDNGWRFHAGDVPNGAEVTTSGSGWGTVNLPHDWSIGGARSADAASSGGGGFFSTGIGWYRLTFPTPEHWRGQRVWLEFEGSYGRTEVWLNNEKLGKHLSGYTPFRFDVTHALGTEDEHSLAVRVDNSAQPNSRWYSGSGLYRRVWLTVVDPVHVAHGSFSVHATDVFPEAATVAIDASIANSTDQSSEIRAEVTVADPAGLPVASAPVQVVVPSGATAPLHVKLPVPHPRLWSPDSPAMYQAVIRVFDGQRMTDRVVTTFGIRTIEVTATDGLLLNGEPLELNGANVHHDHGPLGAAAFAAAEERKVRLLKAAGFNAIRTAHNPPSTAFLDACDRHGLLVIDELFDGWAKAKLKQDSSRHFATTWESDVDAIIRRDRNHPSVVLWSIGNEVYERGSASGAQLAAAMRKRIRALDTTRPITAGINGLGATGDWTRLDPLFASLDVAGYNYELAARHEADHERLPERVILGAESYPKDAFRMWEIVQRHPYVIGDFVWSGQDYLGEAGIGRVFPPDETPFPHWEGSHFPWHGAACGDIDLIGFRKPLSHYRAILWGRGETLYAAVEVPTSDGRPWNLSAWATPPLQASWTWPGHEEKALRVEVFSRHPQVRLYVNDRVIGEAATTEAEAFRATFEVPYAPGELRVAGVRDGREVESFRLTTAGPPTELRLTTESGDGVADGQDLVFVTVEAVDASGRWYPLSNDAVSYQLAGPATIAGIGSADLASGEPYGANPRRLHEGRALVVLRTTQDAGDITLTASAENLAPATLRLTSRLGRAP